MKTFEIAFKKQYSVISNAIDYITTEANLSECYTTYIPYYYSSNNSDCSALKKEMTSRLTLTEIQNDFIDIYAKQSDVFSKGGISMNNRVSYTEILKQSSAYLLPDGAVLLMVAPDHPYYNTSYPATSMIFDVNGKKGPNKWGYDVFFMMLSKHNESGKIRLTDEYASIIEKGGRFPRTILRNENENSDLNRYWD